MKSFGQVIEAWNYGFIARRVNWPSGTFVFKQVPSQIDGEIVPKMKSLPLAVKKEFQQRFEKKTGSGYAIAYHDQLAIVNGRNLIQGWTPSAEDCFSEDWAIYEDGIC